MRARRASLILVSALLLTVSAHAQYAETPRTFGVVSGGVTGVAQIGQRLFVVGGFSEVSPPTGGAVVVDSGGQYVPNVFPRFEGTVEAIVPDTLGGWLVVGDFTRVAGQAQAGFARVRPDRTIDPRYRVVADGPIRRVALAHGRIYLAGNFTTMNDAARRGLAALDALSGRLSAFAATFDAGGRTIAALSVSSIGVYVSGWTSGSAGGRLWGFDATTGAQLFERSVFVSAIAATSARVYVGSFGSERPVWAVDPYTGQDLPWSIGLTFNFISGFYGDYTSIGVLLLDQGRLYLSGYFRTADGRYNLAAVDAASGQALSWRVPGGPFQETPSNQISSLTRLGPAIVATHPGAVGPGINVRTVSAFDVSSGALQTWSPRPYGSALGVSAAPEGALIAGSFNGIGGVARQGSAAFDLTTGALESWTAALPAQTTLQHLATDGTFLFGMTRNGLFLKIDPSSGAVLGSVDFSSDLYRYRVSEGRIVVAAAHPSTPTEIAEITIADWSRRPIPVALGVSDVVLGLEVVGNTVYLAGGFAAVNGTPQSYLAAVDLATGVLLPFQPSPDAQVNAVRWWNNRLVVAGPFRRIGGVRRRGLAELDPVTGRARAWNPDVPGGAQMDVAPDGTLLLIPSSSLSGQPTPWQTLAAISPDSLRRVPWQPVIGPFVFFENVSLAPDCLFLGGIQTDINCHLRALPSPTDLSVEQGSGNATLRWQLPAGAPQWSSIRPDVGRREGGSELATIALPADATAVSGPLGPGPYVARVRTAGATSASLPTHDVSFSGDATPAAPLDATAVTDGTRLTIEWRSPSTGAPFGYVIEAGTAQGRSDVAQIPLVGGSTRFSIDAPPGRYWGRVRVAAGFSAPSGELLLDVDATDSPCYGLPPAAPENFTATVAGSTVTLRWSQPDRGPVANTQRIVVGSGPGLDNLGAIAVPGPATSFATAAPRGTYYVKVVALNSCGASSFSNEVVVVVP